MAPTKPKPECPRTTISIPKSLARKIRRVADYRGLSVSAWARLILEPRADKILALRAKRGR